MCGPPGGRAAARRCARGVEVPASPAGRGFDDRAVRAVDERVGPHGGGHRGDRRRAVGRRVVEGVRVPTAASPPRAASRSAWRGARPASMAKQTRSRGNAGRAHVRTASHAVCIWATYDVMAGHQAGSPAPEGEGGAHGAGPGCTRSGADRASSRPRSGAHNSMPPGPDSAAAGSTRPMNPSSSAAPRAGVGAATPAEAQARRPAGSSRVPSCCAGDQLGGLVRRQRLDAERARQGHQRLVEPVVRHEAARRTDRGRADRSATPARRRCAAPIPAPSGG